MKKTLKIFALFFATAALLSACQDDEKELKTTDVGPVMTVTCDQTAYMGGKIRFTVDMQDPIALSTLKAQLYYDQTLVNTVTIRTKTSGTYTNYIQAPLYKDISDGTATLVFTGQNIEFGKTSKTVEVAVSRPNFDKMTLHIGDTEYTMNKTADYTYEATGNFPEDASATITSPSTNSDGDVITIGWDGSAISASNSTAIPFTCSKAGTYTIKINLKDLTSSPFGNLPVNVTEESPEIVQNMIQGATVSFPGIAGIASWDVDYDFFAVDQNNAITFKPIDGLYKIVADFAKKYLTAVMMKDANTVSSLEVDEKTNMGTGAVWLIGGNVGKPTIGPSWDPGAGGAYCMAETAPGIYQITLKAGAAIAVKDYSVKFFYQNTWGGEFGADKYVANNSPELVKITSGGNIEPADSLVTLEFGKSYSYILDISKGVYAATITVKEADVPVVGLDIHINGVAADRLSATVYKVASIDLTQNQTLNVTGVDNLASYYLDPDYLKIDGGALKFNAVDGKYSIELHMDYNYVVFRKLKANGDEGEIGDGALWLMAWGIANPSMKDFQLRWNPGSAFCMAQVSRMKFQFTGTTCAETDEIIGGRFRYDYLSFKLFYQDNWGGEMKRVVFTPATASILARESDEDGANMCLKDGVTLEKGATYVLTVDMSTGTASGNSYDGVITVDLQKK